MRKAQRKEILEMLQTLEEAHMQIKENVERKNAPSAQTLLVQCQECAIAIGNTIDKLEGEGCVTVSYLETYCDAVYASYEELNHNPQSANGNKIYKNLKKHLLRIENSVKNDIRVKREAVFLPYKASMWDSLESVWKAAEADPDCDAYVIPIPYYDKNPDGSFREYHYEGKQYPKDVPVIWYEDYDFEKRRPDMIYIHNPYDDCNYVTSVHPFFYSGNLKKYTDCLVYIPYFVLGEVNVNNQDAVNNIGHFCTVPGVLNADKVIVESENMRQIYINVLTDFAGKNTKSIWEDKILGTGSPKIDKILRTKDEDLEIPQEWLKVIQKADGSRKKVILYNTSITALLNYETRMLDKIQDVFRIFKDNRDEVALLWRPHPLIKATIESMRPQLWSEYKRIVEQYKEEKWGIYDDTPDIDRAIVISDAYYGDPSSVVQMYQQTGKRIMIQTVNS